MNSRLLTNLAILQAEWVKGSFEGYVPFILTFIKEKKKNSFSIKEIAEWFEKEFARKIPIFAMKSILEDIKNRKEFLSDSLKPNSYAIQKDKVREIQQDYSDEQLIKQYDQLIIDIITDINKDYEVQLTEEEVNTVLLELLIDHDLEIVLDGINNISTIKDFSNRYLVISYIKDCYKTNSDYYDFLVNIAQGHMLANYAIINNRIGNEVDFSHLSFFLDTNVIFSLLKLSDNEFICTGTTQLLDIITSQGGKILIFNHTLEEVRQILDNSKKWVNNPLLYDPIKANDVTRFLMNNNKDIKDIEIYLACIPSLFEKYQINSIEANYNTSKIPLIVETDLYKTIVYEYKRANFNFNETDKSDTIWKDVKSISEVYSYRNNTKPKTIKEAGYMIITLNSALAYVSKKFSDKIYGERVIPACIPAGFLCTYLWMQKPEELYEMNYKRIISKCYQWLKPSPALMKKFLDSINKQKENDLLTDDVYICLKTSPLVEELLAIKTLGDVRKFNARTNDDIIQELKSEGYNEGHKEFLEEKEAHEKTKEKLDEIQDVLNAYQNKEKRERQHYRNLALTRTRRQYKGLIILLVIMLIIMFASYIIDNLLVRILSGIFTIILTVVSIFWGINFKNIKERIQAFNENRIAKKEINKKMYDMGKIINNN